MYVCMCVCIYIHIYIYTSDYCTAEVNTSETIVDFKRHLPRGFNYSVVFPKGLSLVQRIFTGNSQWIFSGIFQSAFICRRSGFVSFCPARRSATRTQSSCAGSGTPRLATWPERRCARRRIGTG